MPSSSAGRVRLHIDDTGGDGRPVVLIHGWPLSAASWKSQVEPLRSAGYRVVAYDRRGFGRSDKPPGFDSTRWQRSRGLTRICLHDATDGRFFQGGGEVARYVANHGEGA